MQEHLIGKNYRYKHGLPELKSEDLIADVVSVVFEKKCTVSGAERNGIGSIHAHANILSPIEYKNTLLEVFLCSTIDTSSICVPECGEHGVGQLKAWFCGENIEKFILEAIFSPSTYRELEIFLFKSYLDGRQLIQLKASALGMGQSYEWEMGKGPLLIKEMKFAVGSHKA